MNDAMRHETKNPLAIAAFIVGVLGIAVTVFAWMLCFVTGIWWDTVMGLCGWAGSGAALAATVLGGIAAIRMRRAGEHGKYRWYVRGAVWSFPLWILVTVVGGLLSAPFFGAAPRSKVARAKSEIRNIAVNVETYYIDHDTYPPAMDLRGRIVPIGEFAEGVSAGYVPWLLTTPVAYTSSLPLDPFHKTRVGYGPYRYATNGEGCWIMTSRGPDGDDDITIVEFPSPGVGDCQFRKFMSQFGGPAIEYDGTNGTMSSGDILRVGP